MSELTGNAHDLLFRQARTHSVWLDRPVSEQTLRELYELMKWPPTSLNSAPARLVFVTTEEAKSRLLPALSPGNVEKTMAAPATAIIAYDLRFYDRLPELLPQNPAARDRFSDSPSHAEATAQRNSSLQGAYLILAARSLGLDCGPMSGFNNAKVDEAFFGAGEAAPEDALFGGYARSNFLCNLGYADYSKVRPRNPRLDFEEVCRIV